jgi:chromosome segregation and condensation protein ScpB
MVKIMAKKERALSPEALEVLAVLQDSDTPMTLADIKTVLPNANSSHLTALANRALVSADKVEKEVATVTKRTVNSYSFNTPAEDVE